MVIGCTGNYRKSEYFEIVKYINDFLVKNDIKCVVSSDLYNAENLDKNKLQKIFDHKILPLLKEYYFAEKRQIEDIESKFNQVLKNWNVDGN